MLKSSVFPALAMLVVASAAPALGQDVKYVGNTTNTFQGDEGVLLYHQECQAVFPASHWCTSKQIIEGGPKPGFTASGSAWVQPVVVAADQGSVVEYSGLTSSSASSFLTCNGWGSASSAQRGLAIIRGRTPPAFFFEFRCDQFFEVACCTTIR